jgi:hypothetical protein
MTTMFTTIIPISVIIALPILYVLKRYVSIKITHWLLVIYGAILLASLILVAFTKPLEVGKINATQENIDLYEIMHNGEISKLGKNHLIDAQSFEYKGENITLTSPNGENNSTVFVERKTEDDGRIDVHFYGSGLYMEGINLTEKIILPSLRMEEGTLSIIHPGFQEINIAVVKDEFTINQFTGERDRDQGIHFDGPIIYLQIPQHLEIKKDEYMHLQFVGE